MKSRKTLSAAALGLSVLAGCGARSELDNGNFQETQTPQEPHDPPDDPPVETPDNVQLLTRRMLAEELVGDVMKLEGECVLSFPDVSVNDSLCYPAHVLRTLDADKGFPDGTFKPDEYVLRAQAWKAVSRALGLIGHDSVCLDEIEDASYDDWYGAYVGAFCRNGLPVLKEEGKVEPGEVMTVEEFDELKDVLSVHFNRPLARYDLAELTVSSFLNEHVVDVDGCEPVYVDVDPNSVECVTTNMIFDAGYIGELPDGEFRGTDYLNHAEMSKFLSLLGGIEPVTSGCSGADQSTWYADYMDGLCEAGYLPEEWPGDPGAIADFFVTSQTVWMMDLDNYDF